MEPRPADPPAPSRSAPADPPLAIIPGQVPDLPAGLGEASDPEAPLPFAREDVLAAEELLTSTDDRPEPVLVLTDEQLVALEGHARRQHTATPWIREHSEQRTLLAGSALRGLLADGRVRRVREDATGRVLWQAEPQLAACLVLRRTAPRFTTAERTRETTAGVEVDRVHHYAHAGGVLEEEVTAEGMHRFTVLRTEQVPERLLRLWDPEGVAGPTGDAVVLRISALDSSPLAAALAGTRAMTLVTVAAAAEDAVHQASLYATGQEVLVMEVLDPAADDPHLEFRRVDAVDLRALAAVLVGGGPADDR